MKRKSLLFVMLMFIMLFIPNMSSEAYAANNYKVGSTYYHSLAEAVAAASDNGTIYVSISNTDTSTVTINKNLTLNTNEKTITKNTTGIIVNSGKTLSIIGSGKITTSESFDLIKNNGTLNLTSITLAHTGTSTSYSTIYNSANCTTTINSGTITSKVSTINNYGTLIIKNGTIKSDYDFDGYTRTIYNRVNATLTVSGGTISSTNATKYARAITSAGNVKIENGTISANGYSAISIDVSSDSTSSTIIMQDGTLNATSTVDDGIARGISSSGTSSKTINSQITISGGTINANAITTANARAIYLGYNSGTINITSGTVNTNGYGIYCTDGQTGAITIGNSTGSLNKETPAIKASASYGIYAPNGFNFYNGSISGTNSKAYSGTTMIRPGAYQIETDGPVDGIYTSYLVSTENYNYQVNTEKYITLKDAFDNAPTGATVIVLKNVIDDTEAQAIVPSGKELTLDTKGYTIIKKGNRIRNEGTLHIVGNGKITGALENWDLIYNTSILTITNVTIENTYTGTTQNFAIQSRGTVTINSGTVSAKQWTIYNRGTLEINGGTVIANGTNDNKHIYAILQNIEGNAVLNITGGTVSAVNNGASGSRAIIGGVNDQVTISNATIKAEAGTDAVAITYEDATAATLIISEGAKIEATSLNNQKAIGIHWDSNTALDCTIEGNAEVSQVGTEGGAIDTGAGTLKLVSGTVKATNYAIKADGETVIGNSDDAVSITSPEIMGDTYGIIGDTTALYFNDGVIKGVDDPATVNDAYIITPTYYETTIEPKGETKYNTMYLTLVTANSFITKWNIPGNITITLPIPANVSNNYIVDWGDDTVQSYTTEAFPTHTYTDPTPTTYEIKIAGAVNLFGYDRAVVPTETGVFSRYYTFTQYLSGITSWGEIGATKYGFANCVNLAGTLPNPTENSFTNITDFDYAFYNCMNLGPSVSTEIFDTVTKATSFKAAFAGCLGLTTATIDLATISSQMFYACNNLTEITIGENAQTIEIDAFQATDPYSETNFLETNLTSTNLVATEYDWKSDYRGLGYGGNIYDVSNAKVILNPTTYTYDGTAKTPEATVVLNNDMLTQGTHYNVTYENNIEVGTATAIITGIGSYIGTIRENFVINPAEDNVENDDFFVDTVGPIINSITAVAEENITITATMTDPVLADGSEGSGVNTTATKYAVTSTNEEPNEYAWQTTNVIPNTFIGEIFIWVKAVDNVGNETVRGISLTATTEINTLDITTTPDSFVYDGTAKKLIVTIKDGAKTLIENTDYTLNYENNINVGTATLTIIGQGYYIGTATRTFSITRKPIDAPTGASLTYNGSLQSGVVVGEGYTLSGEISETNAGTYTVTATLDSNHMWSDGNVLDKTINWEIKQKAATVVAKEQTITFGNSVAQGADYAILNNAVDGHILSEVTLISNISNVGEGIITPSDAIIKDGNANDVTANYAITYETATVTITAKSLTSGITVSLPKTVYDYTGSAITPTPIVTDGTTPLALGTDYTVSYENHINVGTATVTITGEGNYTGDITLEFTIVAVTPTITIKDKTVTYNGTVITVDEAIVAGLASGTIPDGEVTYTYYTDETCTTKTTTSDNSGATVAGGAPKNVGIYYVKAVIAASGNYTAATSEKATITINVKELTIIWGNTSLVFTGSAQKPTATVESGVGGETVNLSVTGEKTAVGGPYTATASISSVTGTNNKASNYSIMNPTIDFYITNDNISLDATVSPTTFVYDGTSKAPTVTVTADVGGSTKILTEGTDYEVIHDTSKDVGTKTITITGINNYAGKGTIATFAITTKTLTYIPNAGQNKVYGTANPTLTGSFTGNVDSSEPGLNGTLSRVDGEDVGKYEITKGSIGLADNGTFKASNYTLEFTTGVEFEITPKNIAELSLSLEQTTYTYDGKAKTPDINTISYAGMELLNRIDYIITYASNTNAGQATATVKGQGNFTGSKTLTFTIKEKSVSELTITLEPANYIYDGGNKTPTLTVKDGDKTLNKGVDYTVSGTTTAIDADTYVITVTGEDNYTGTVNRSWTISQTENTLTVTGKTGLEYNQNAQELVTVSNAQGDVYFAIGTELTSANYETAGSKTIPTGTDAKVYTIYYYTPGNQNYKAASGNVTSSIVNSTMTGITSTGYEGIYDGAQHGITVNLSETSVGATVKYGTVEGTYNQTNSPTYKNAGTYTVYYEVSKANYDTVTGSAKVVITAKSISDLTVTLNPTSYVYDGEDKTPTLTVKYGSVALAKDTDYTVIGTTTAKDANTYTITVTGKENYNGTVNKTWTIEKANNTLVVIGKTGVSYTGSAQELATIASAQGDVYFAIGTELTSSNYETAGSKTIPTGTEAKSYTIYYYTPGNNNYKATSGSVTSSIGNSGMTGITATGYEGVYDGTFHGITVTLSETSAGATVKYGTVNGTYNETTSPTYKNVGTYTVYYQVSKTNYDTVTGSAKVVITAKSLTNVTVTLEPTTYVYDGTNKTPTLTVKDGSVEMAKDTDYIVTGTTVAKDVNTYTVTVTGAGNYTGTVNKTWTISQTENTLTVTGKTGLIYNQNAQELVTISNAQGDVYFAIGTELTVENYASKGIKTIPTGIDAKTYTIYYYTPGNQNYKATSGSVVVLIGNATMTGITASGYEGVYDGAQHGIIVNLSETSTGATVKYKTTSNAYDGTTSPTYKDAGIYTVYYQVSKANYDTVTGSATVKITVKSLTNVTVTLEPTTYVYDGANKTPTLTVKDGSVAMVKDTDYTVTGTTTAKDANIYTIIVTGKGNYTGTVNKAWTIEKANNTLVVTGKTGLSYTGSAQALVTIASAQGDVYFAIGTELTSENYSTVGNKTIPTGVEAKSYTIYYYTPGNNNYKATSGSVTSSIGNSGMTGITANGYEGVYDGAYHGIRVTLDGTSAGAIVKYGRENGTYNETTSPTYKNVGTYTVYYQVSKENYDTVTGSAKVVITAKSLTNVTVTLNPTTYVYDGANKTPTLTVKDGSVEMAKDTDYIVTGTTTAKDANTYTITVTGKGNYTGTVNKTWTIEKANNTLVVTGKTGLSYTGSVQELVTIASAQGDVYFAIGTELTSTNYETAGSKTIPTGTEAKSYTIYYYTPGNNNYKATSGSVTSSIGNSGMTGITVTGYEGVYDGTFHGITVTLSETSAGATVKYGTVNGTYNETTSPTYKNVGTYTVYYQVSKENYDTVTGSAKVVITAKALTNVTVTLDPTSYVYDGVNKTPTLTVKDGDVELIKDTDYTVSGTTVAKDVNTYTITVTGKGNYNGSVNKTWTITQTGNTLVVIGKTDLVYNTNAQELVAVSNAQGDVYFAIGTKLTSANYETAGSKTIPTGTDAKVYTIYYYTPGNQNYKATSGSVTATIINAAMTGITVTGYEGIYDGASHGITVALSETSTGAIVRYGIVSGSCDETASPTYKDVGTYTVYYQVSKANYNTVTGSAKVVITAKALTNVTVTLEPTTYVYDGTNKTPTLTVKDGSVVMVKDTDYTVTGTTIAKDANTYTITATGKGNYNGTVNKTWTIGKANNTLVVTGKTGLSYTGSAQELVAVSNVQGDVYFAIGTELTSENYTSKGTTTIPTGVEAKGYTIYYYTPGNGNYKATSGSVTASIGNSGMTGITANGYTGVYDGAYHGITVTLGETSTGATIKYGTVNGTYNETTSPTYKNVGTYTVYYQVSKENYDIVTGSAKVTITAKELTNVTIVLNPTNYIYDGVYKTPGLTVKDGDTELVKDTDYTVNGTETARDANTYTITVTGNGNYAGTVNITWSISQADNTLNVTGKTGLLYNETAQELVTVTNKQGAVYFAIGTELTSENYADKGTTSIPTGTDAREYTVFYYTPGNQNYKATSGSVNVSIGIADMTGITVNGYEGIYDGNAYGITVNLSETSAGATVKYGTTEGTYELTSTPKYTNAGEYTIFYEITKANYNTVRGSAKVIITAKSVSGLTIILEPSSFIYDGNEKVPNITVKDGNKELVKGSDYTVTGTIAATDVGNYTVTITGNKNYAGSKNAVFGITQAENTLVVTAKTGLTYTGAAQELVIVENPQGDVYFAIGTELTSSNYTTAGSKIIPTGVEAKGYTIYYYTPGNNNYKAIAGNVNVTIAISGMTGITANGYTGVYDGEEHGITVRLNGTSAGATVKYGKVEGTYNQTSSPTYKNVGTYIVYYQVSKENYDTVTGSATVKITTKSINDLELTFAPITFVYNAQNQGPTITLKDNNGTLSATTDYTLSGTLAAKDVGTYEVKITAKGNYTGEITESYTITPLNPTIELEDKEATYTGSVISIGDAKVTGVTGDTTPTGTITYTYYTDNACSIKTSTSVGATVTGGAPAKVGTYYVKAIIEATGNYGVAISNVAILKINAKDLNDSGMTATLSQTEYVYDGNAKQPEVTVKDNTKELTKGTDFVVAYSNNTNAADASSANAPTVTVTGIGNYAGTINLKFTIKERAQDITLTNYSGIYDGSAHTITVAGSDVSGATISYDTNITDGKYDMTTLPEFTNVGTYTVYVKVEKPNTVTYTGSATVEIKVKEVAVSWGNTTLDYTGSAQVPTAVANSGVANENIKLDITGAATNIGDNYTATATISRVEGGQGDKNNYKLTDAQTTFKIVTPEGIQIEVNFEGMGVGEELNKEYNGAKHQPNVEVRIKGTSTELTLNKDYSVTYENNLNVGTATVRVTPINNYAGVAETVITFEITKKDLIVTPTANQSNVFGSAANITYTYTGNVTNTAMDPDTLEEPKFTGGLVLAIPTGSDITEVGEVGTYIITKGNLAISDNSPFLANNYNLVLNSSTVNYTITEKTISELTIALKENVLTYNGKAQTPEVADITFNGKTLVENTDYTVTYNNNIDAGQATATITGIGNYKGTKVLTFTINPKTVDVVWGSTTLYYEEGKSQLPKYSINSGVAGEAIVLDVAGAQSEIGYGYIAKAEIAEVTGGQAKSSNYTLGNATILFNIIISGDSEFILSFEELANDGTANVVYSGAKQEPKVKVEVKDTLLELVEGTDYKVEYTNNLNVGTATVAITGLNDFSSLAAVSTTFEITKKDLIVTPNSNQSIIYGGVVDIQYTYTGNVTNTAMSPSTLEVPTFTGKLELSPITEGIVGIGEVGEYKIVKGNLALKDNTPFLVNNYNLVLNPTEVSFTITKKNISQLDCSLTKTTYVYDGLEKQPDVNMLFDGEELVKGKDYTITYTNNIDAGTATATVTGINRFTGTKQFTFEIKPMEITITWSNILLSHTGSAQVPTVGDTAGANGEVIKFTVSGAQTNVGTNYTATAAITEVVGGRADKDNYTIKNPTTLFTITSQAVPKAPIIKATLSTFKGDTYISGANTNKSVLIELTTTQAIDVYKYEWSTSQSSGFNSANLFTSNEIGRIRFDSEINQTIYFRLQDRNGNYSDVSSIIINIDKTVPTGSIDILEMYEKDGLKYTNTHIVDIEVTASDNKAETSNIDIALINEEDFSWSNLNADLVWRDYEPTMTWELSFGEGLKKVYAIFRDEAGNQSVYLATYED